MALLAYLAVTAQPHSRDVLAALFWPETDQTSARNYLRHDLFELKNAIGEDNLLVERERVGLNREAGLWVDVNEFRTQVQKVHLHGHLETGSEPQPPCPECQAILAQAISLFTADFMAGFSLPEAREFEEWQFDQGNELRQFLGEALSLLIAWHTSREEYEPAINYARRQLTLDPLSEPAHRQLMRVLAWAGQQSAALHQYQECARLMHDELGIEPDEETRRLFEAIRRRKLAPPLAGGPQQAAPPATAKTGQPSGVSHYLPPLHARLIGRDRELERISQLLCAEAECRLLTLVGPGGIGKTSLAIEAASRQADNPACSFRDGVYYVSLVGLSQAEAIVPAIAEALNLPLLPDPVQRVQQLFDFLQPKCLLLVLDNFEHLISDQSIRLLVDLLAHDPLVKLMVTSRERLNAHFEQVLTLRGLDTPPPETDFQVRPVEEIVADYPAIKLFSRRAGRVKPDFAINADNLLPVAQICRMVEGLPLGIELAAAWLEVLTPAEIAVEITHSLDFLAAQWPDMPERHHSLRAVFESSWGMLAEQERSALMCLALFPGSFSRPAALKVTGASIHTLLGLVNKSWLLYQENGRYQIHELLRQFAEEKLRADPDGWQLAMERFSAYYLAFMGDHEEMIKGPRQKEAFEAIAVEFENIRLAWQWLVEHGNVGLAVNRMLLAMYRYTRACARPLEMAQIVDMAIRHTGLKVWEQSTARVYGPKDVTQADSTADPILQAVLLTARVVSKQYGAPGVYFFEVVLSANDKTLLQAWRLAGKVETLKAMGFWGILLPTLYGVFDDPQPAIRCLNELLLFFRQQNRPWEVANALYLLAGVIIARLVHGESTADLDAARQLLLEALAIFTELGDKSSSAYVLVYLSRADLNQKKYIGAIEHLKAAQASLQEIGETVAAANIFSELSETYQKMGDFEAAFHYFHLWFQACMDKGDKLRAAIALAEESLVASRYSNLEHARQTRLQNLSLSQETGFAPGAAWAVWEIGEINRLAGDLAGAREWYEKGRAMLEQLKEPTGPVFYHRGLGDIAQATGDFLTAKKQFQESLKHAESTRHAWSKVYALCGLGRAETALKETEAAQEHFRQGLEIAKVIDLEDMMLICLAGLAGDYATTGDLEQAVELSAMVINHKQSWNETRAQMAALLGSITALPPERLAAAQERGRSLTIEEAVRRVGL